MRSWPFSTCTLYLASKMNLGLVPSDSRTQSGYTDILLTVPVFSLVLVPSENPFWGTTVERPKSSLAATVNGSSQTLQVATK